ncbi:MAG: hypothetical protein HFJ11_02490 [Bacilli bacterium]|nr:hypothetical protein [Bacilli bacterium]
MLDLEYLQRMLIIAIALSTITCAFIQKTKKLFKSSNYISIYSFIVNLSIGIIFCMTFTDINFPRSLWVGLFSFLGADTIYKSLEGKITPHRELVTKKKISILKENIINKEEK